MLCLVATSRFFRAHPAHHMPTSDRRREIAEAAWRVVVRDGLDRASLRAVAREVGATTGSVTHHFADRDDLLATALDLVFERTVGDADRDTSSLRGLDRIERLVLAAMPTGDARDWQVWVAFLGYSVGRPALMARHRQRYSTLRALLADEIHAARAEGATREDISPPEEADALVALVDGIGLRSVVDGKTPPTERLRLLVGRALAPLRW